MKPRILISAHLYGPAGIETHLLNLCRLLVANGAEVTLACRIASKDVPLVQLHRRLGVELVKTPFANEVRLFRASTAWAFANWPRRLRRAQFDVLYSLHITRFTRFLSQFVKPKGFVLWNRIGNFASASEPIEQSLLEMLNGVIVETEPQAAAIRAAYRIKGRVAAISHLAHHYAPAPREVKGNGVLRVAFLGRYDRDKGVYRLLDLWPTLDIGKAELNFYGHGRDHQQLKSRVKSLETVKVNSSYSERELGDLLANTDLVVLPSFSEGLPLVLLEAMAHGVPFVATDVGAIRSLAENNPDVMVVPNSDEAIRTGLENMARAVRAGEIDGRRLQQYHARHFGVEKVAPLWIEALVNPEDFWTEERGSVADPSGASRLTNESE